MFPPWKKLENWIRNGKDKLIYQKKASHSFSPKLSRILDNSLSSCSINRKQRGEEQNNHSRSWSPIAQGLWCQPMGINTNPIPSSAWGDFSPCFPGGAPCVAAVWHIPREREHSCLLLMHFHLALLITLFTWHEAWLLIILAAKIHPSSPP